MTTNSRSAINRNIKIHAENALVRAMPPSYMPLERLGIDSRIVVAKFLALKLVVDHESRGVQLLAKRGLLLQPLANVALVKSEHTRGDSQALLAARVIVVDDSQLVDDGIATFARNWLDHRDLSKILKQNKKQSNRHPSNAQENSQDHIKYCS